MSDERQQSEFNMAVSYLNRLNALFYSCDEAAMNLDTYQWYHSLMVIFRELSTEMKPEEITAMSKLARETHNFITSNNMRNARTRQTEVNADVYDKLHEFELKLRLILKQAGLQNKMVESAMNALK